MVIDPITLTLIGIGKYVLGHVGVHAAVSSATAAAVGTATVAAGIVAVATISYLTFQTIQKSLQQRAINKSRQQYAAFGALIRGDLRSGNINAVDAGIWKNSTSSKGYLTGFVDVETGELADVEIIECSSIDSNLTDIHRRDPIVVYD